MKNYDTLVEAMNDLKKQGYDDELNLKSDHLECTQAKCNLTVDDFEVDQMYRFEGMTNPADSSVLYAISSESKGVKGLLVDAYGTYANPMTEEMIKKLDYNAKEVNT